MGEKEQGPFLSTKGYVSWLVGVDWNEGKGKDSVQKKIGVSGGRGKQTGRHSKVNTQKKSTGWLIDGYVMGRNNEWRKETLRSD